MMARRNLEHGRSYYVARAPPQEIVWKAGVRDPKIVSTVMPGRIESNRLSSYEFAIMYSFSLLFAFTYTLPRVCGTRNTGLAITVYERSRSFLPVPRRCAETPLYGGHRCRSCLNFTATWQIASLSNLGLCTWFEF